MSAGIDYFEKSLALLHSIKETQMPHIDKAAEICTESIANGGLVFLFGAGHSRMMCEEMTPRQGGFVGFYALVELAISNHSAIIGPNGLRGPLHLEKYEGYAEEILKSFKFGPHDAFILDFYKRYSPTYCGDGVRSKRAWYACSRYGVQAAL